MAKQRPQLGVAASPVSAFVAPIDPMKQVAPVDEAGIRNAFAFADAFAGLSESVAGMAATLKKQSNEEQRVLGQQLINQSRKNYADLEKSGAIDPAENPWFAVGAQEASGAIEAANSSIELQGLVTKYQNENPGFLDDPKNFDVLVADYVSRKSQQFGSAQYLSASFFENFNPTVVKLQRDNAEAVDNRRVEKFVQAADSRVKLAVDSLDIKSKNIGERTASLQAQFDNDVANSGGRASEITQAYASALVGVMTENPEKAYEAEYLLNSLMAGTAPLGQTSVARNLLMKFGPQIEANKDRMNAAESRAIFDKRRELLDKYEKGYFGSGTEAHTRLVDELDRWIEDNARNVDVSVATSDQEREYLYGKAQAIDDAAARAREDALKQAEELDKKSAADAKEFRKQFAAQQQLMLRNQVLNGAISPAAATDIYKTTLGNPALRYESDELLGNFKTAEEDFSKLGKQYSDALVFQKSKATEEAVVESMVSSFQQNIRVEALATGQAARPVNVADISRMSTSAISDIENAQKEPLTEGQRAMVRDRIYRATSRRAEEVMDVHLMSPAEAGGRAPVQLSTLEDGPNDSPQVRDYKRNARLYKNDAKLALDEAFKMEDNIAYWRNIAATEITTESVETGGTSRISDLYDLWNSSTNGYFRTNMFDTQAGGRLNSLFQRVRTAMAGPRKMSFQDALADALSTTNVTGRPTIEDWTQITQAASADQEQFDSHLRNLLDNMEIRHQDAVALVSTLYADQMTSLFQSGPTQLNLARSMSDAKAQVEDKIIVFDGAFMIKEGPIGTGSYTADHFRNLARFYAPGAESPVFVPVKQGANGEFMYALRDADGSIIYDALFSVRDIASPEALEKSTYYRMNSKGEREWHSSKNISTPFIDRSATFEARNQRLRLMQQASGR